MAKQEQPEQKKNFIVQIRDYFRDSWIEVKRVHFPTREETIQHTIVVIAMIFLFAFFLGMTDFLVGRLMQTILT